MHFIILMIFRNILNCSTCLSYITQRTMFNDAGFKLNTTSGRVFTEGAPDTQPSGTDGMPGGFDPNNNPDGGVKEIDSWCPRYIHAKAKAIEKKVETALVPSSFSAKRFLFNFSKEKLLPLKNAAANKQHSWPMTSQRLTCSSVNVSGRPVIVKTAPRADPLFERFQQQPSMSRKRLLSAPSRA